MIKKLILLIMVLSNSIFASTYATYKSDNDRAKVVEKTLNYLLLDFRSLKKEILLLKLQNKIIEDEISNIASIQKNRGVYKKPLTTTLLYKVKKDFTPSFAEKNINSKITKLLISGALINALSDDGTWVKTKNNKFIKTNKLIKIKIKVEKKK
ncbi:MAG: hypothetical protein DRG78_02350 [Epsilonproteobacteria bacterium]|nr:MAG: hypothetical protein DRG78_02350 [Campylobacterota bacterium]